MDILLHPEAFLAAAACAALLVNVRFAISAITVALFCGVRSLEVRAMRPRGAKSASELPEEVLATLREGDALYAGFEWRVRALVTLAAAFSEGRSVCNRAAISLCIVRGFYSSLTPLNDGGVMTNGLAWTDSAAEGLRLAFGVNSFSRSLAANFVGSMTDRDRARLFKSYFELGKRRS